MKNMWLAFLLICCVVNQSYSQDDSLLWKAGAGFFYNISSHSADFKKIPDCPSCSPGYELGLGNSPSFMGIFEYPLSNKLYLGANLSYFSYGAKLTKDEEMQVFIHPSGIDTSIQYTGVFTHTLDATLASLGLEPNIKYFLFSGFYVLSGVHLGFVISKSYDQKEEVTKPSDVGTFGTIDDNGDFVDSYKRTRNELKGVITKANPLNMSVFAGLGWEFPMNKQKTMLIEPQVRFNYGLLPIIDDPSVPKWNYMTYGAGIAIKYSPQVQKFIEQFERKQLLDTIEIFVDDLNNEHYSEGKSKVDTSIYYFDDIKVISELTTRIDTLYIHKQETLECSIIAKGADTLGNEYENPKFTIEEFISNRIQPLLPYIFFDNNSSDFQSKYSILKLESVKSYSLSSIYKKSTLETYYEIMNIIGYRMTQYPDANLKLMGCNSDYGDEDGNKKLSLRRAEQVKNYLTQVWGLDPARLSIGATNLPDKPSLPKNESDKEAENRRVEFYSDNYEILAPVYIEDTLRTASPPIARFFPKITSSGIVKKFNIKAYQDNVVNANLDTIVYGYDNEIINWRLTDNKKTVPNMTGNVKYEMTVEDMHKNICKTEMQSMPLEYISVTFKRQERKDDIEYNRYSLILFDFNEYKITGNNSKIIKTIRDVIKPNSIVKIYGYTDRTGEEDYNSELSLNRAEAANESIGHKSSTTTAIGEIQLLYNNEIPEGRFYCRTVDIIIETPINE